MSNEALGKQHTLWEILDSYDKIEIPIIQRDYAQGRESAKKVRDGILNHILGAADRGNPVELDFIYGIENTDDNGETKSKVFIPIDGQQRLTTLWLIHWYLAHRAGLLDSPENGIARKLRKFCYETRPSSNDFLNRLCDNPVAKDTDIRKAITDEAPWFDEAWKLDPSIMGFLTMLEAIENHKCVKEKDPKALFNRLTCDNAVSFYFLRLEKFGLGEEIYTRMNARGKVLTDFETFKSNFFKIIDESPLKEEIADKIEYAWVENLWDYREKGAYVIDEPFKRWMRFVTQILFILGNEADKAPEKETDYLSPQILEEVYSKEENLRFLIHAFDSIPALVNAPLNLSLYWDEEKGLEPLVKWLLTEFTSTHTLTQLGVFAALLFLEKQQNTEGFEDFMRVVRNLIENNPDTGIREWPAMIASIRTLISPDVYAVLREKGASIKGFRSEQVRIEVYKANLLQVQPEALTLIRNMDDNASLKGRLENIIIESQEPAATAVFTLSLNDISPTALNLAMLENMFNGYKAIAGDDGEFNDIWGDLLPTSIYKENQYTCWWENGNSRYTDYYIHPVILKIAREVTDNKCDVDKVIIGREKSFVKQMLSKYNGDLSQVNTPKEQLYLLYIMTMRMTPPEWQWNWKNFFVNERYNFGWTKAEAGFTTPFTGPLVNGGARNPIYQAYSLRFNSSCGIRDYRTPSILFAIVRGPKILERLVEWAES